MRLKDKIAVITGGTAPYIEDWSGEDPNALTAGSYTMSVTDNNGCAASASYIVNMSGTQVVVDIIDLNAGWNLISTDVSPVDPSISAIVSNLLIVKRSFKFIKTASFYYR